MRLATRSTRGFALTALGESYHDYAQRLLADLSEADAAIRGEQAALSGVLRVAAPLSFGLRHVAPVVARLMFDAPDLRFELDLSDRRIDLVNEGVDLAVRVGRLDDSSLIARKLRDIRHVCAASPTFWEKHGIPKSPAELSGYPHLAYRSSAGAVPWNYRTPNGDSGTVSFKPRLLSSNGEGLVIAAEQGLGVLLEPDFVCGDAIDRGTLRPVFEDHDWVGVAAYVVYPAGRPLPARARRFIDMLTAESAPNR